MSNYVEYSNFDVYLAFRRASGKPFRIPKDWDASLEKMQRQNKDALNTLTGYFNTKWRNIDLDKYMACGFELFPNFTYVKFFDTRIVNLYISRDKIAKRACEVDKRNIIDSAKFIKEQMKERGFTSLKQYARCRDGFSSLAVTHYLHGALDSIVLFYLIYNKYIFLEDNDKAQLSYILENFRTLKCKVLSILDFLRMVEEKLNVRTV